MKVILTPQGEEALAERVKRESALPSGRVLERLKRMPGVSLPDHWPAQFGEFEPISVDGEPVSEQLIRERR